MTRYCEGKNCESKAECILNPSETKKKKGIYVMIVLKMTTGIILM